MLYEDITWASIAPFPLEKKTVGAKSLNEEIRLMRNYGEEMLIECYVIVGLTSS